MKKEERRQQRRQQLTRLPRREEYRQQSARWCNEYRQQQTSCSTASASASETAAALATANAALLSACASLNVTSAALSTFAAGLSPLAMQRQPGTRHSSADIEQTEALLLRQFLTDKEVLLLFEIAASMPTMSSPISGSAGDVGVGLDGTAAAATTGLHDVTYSSMHVAQNLHRDGYFFNGYPELSSKIVREMAAQLRDT